MSLSSASDLAIDCATSRSLARRDLNYQGSKLLAVLSTSIQLFSFSFSAHFPSSKSNKTE